LILLTAQEVSRPFNYHFKIRHSI